MCRLKLLRIFFLWFHNAETEKCQKIHLIVSFLKYKVTVEIQNTATKKCPFGTKLHKYPFQIGIQRTPFNEFRTFALIMMEETSEEILRHRNQEMPFLRPVFQF